MKRRSKSTLVGLLLLLSSLWTMISAAQANDNTSFLPIIVKEDSIPTSIATAMPTLSPTATETSTPSATATETNTASPTPESTSTSTPSNTFTPTSTNSPTPFPTLGTPVPHFPLAYGPYRTEQAPGGATPSPEQIAEDMSILKQETNLIRTYGSCNELATIPAAAEKQEIYLYQGLNISKTPTDNEAELNCFQALVGKQHNLHAAIVGNEVLLRGDLSEAQLTDYLTRTKQMGNLDVSTGESWAKWCNLQNTKPRCPGLSMLPDKVDFLTIHVHPYWEAVPIEHAAAHVIAVQIFVRTTFTDKPVILGEAAWPSCGSAKGNAQPSIANQRRFIEELWKWTRLYDIRAVYFEAFDEPWKVEPNGVGPCWGMYYVDRTPKHANLDWSIPTAIATPTAPTVQIDHPTSNLTTTTKTNCGLPIFGRVYHAQPGWKVKVEVFTNDWYLQDKWYLDGLAPIIDGQWAMPEVILAGQGSFNNHKIRATLVDSQGNPKASSELQAIVRANVTCTP